MAASADPTRRGPHAFESFEYDAGEFLVQYGTRTAYPERLRGSVHHPKSGRGFPVVLLLHGNHTTCRVVFYETLTPCVETPVTHDVPSYSGYEYLAENLASHGYVVVSASANGTNGATFISEETGTRGRVEVIQRTLALVEAWAAKPQPDPVGRRLTGRLDLSRIGLMGHSRGGEAVTRFIAHNRVNLFGRWPLRAVVALAATDFARHRPSGVPFAALLPTCDGDVYDLQGAHAFERAADNAPRVQWVVRGTNHNFFNTIWTYDDGGTNPSSPCRRGAPSRLTDEGQQQVGLSLIGAFLRRFVGGEMGLDAAATWRPHQPAGACNEPCADVIRPTFLPAGAESLVLPSTQEGALSIKRCDVESTPCPSRAHRSWTSQLFLRWAQPAEVTLEAAPSDLRGRSIVLRVGVDRDHADNRGVPAVAVRLVDRRGRVAVRDVRQPALRALDEWIYGEEDDLGLAGQPASGPTHVVLSDVRVATSGFTGVDLKHIRSISLVLGGRGSMYLAAATLQ